MTPRQALGVFTAVLSNPWSGLSNHTTDRITHTLQAICVCVGNYIFLNSAQHSENEQKLLDNIPCIDRHLYENIFRFVQISSISKCTPLHFDIGDYIEIYRSLI